MKYIKKYEIKKITEPHQRFNKGDYVLLNDEPEHGWTVFMLAKILKKKIVQYDTNKGNFYVYYTLSTIEKKTGKELILTNIDSEVVVRKLTSEEKNEYEFLLVQNKYNL